MNVPNEMCSLKPNMMGAAPNVECHKQEVNRSLWSKRLAFVGYGATLGSAVPAGYCIGVMNSPAVHMRAWCNVTLIARYDLHLNSSTIDILWSAIVSVFLVGGAVGSLNGAWAANKYGRKGSFLLCGLLYLISAMCFYSCRLLASVELLLLARLLVGMAAGLTTACLPMYLSEIAPLELRGTLGVFCPVGLTAGVVFGQMFSLRSVFGTAELWHVAMSFYVLIVLVCYAPFCFYTESPKWLYIVRGQRELAAQQLQRLRGTRNPSQIAHEIDAMMAEVAGEEATTVCSFSDVLRNKTLLLPLVIVCAYQGGQQLSGINAIFYYSVSIFRKAGLTAETAEWLNLGAGSLNLAVSLVGPVLMKRYNRRPLMLFSSACCALALLAFALMLNFIEHIIWFSIGCIACIFLYIFFFQFGIGPIPFFIGAELFDIAPRPVAMSMGSLTSWCCNFVIGMTFPSLQNAWGAFVFLPFSGTCALLFVLTKLYLPETRGRDAANVAMQMAGGFKSPLNNATINHI